MSRTGKRKPYGTKHPHGTTARYQYHLIHGEKACDLCKEAQRNQKRSRYKPKRGKNQPTKVAVNRALVREAKFAAGSCMDCGLVVDDRTIVCFDMDHRDPLQKSFTISRQMQKATANEMRDEIAKCDVVCRNCHAIRTHQGQHHKLQGKSIRTQTDDIPTLFDVA